jgi:hypothetical protein
MLNKLFSLIGVSISASGGGVTPAATQFVYNVSFPAYGTFISEETLTDNEDVGGVNTAVGSYSRAVYADGVGGTYIEESSTNFYSYGTELRQESGTIDISLCGGNYSAGGYTNYWYSDGAGGYWTNTQGGYTPYGAYLANCDGNNHYSDGNGSYYSESDGSGGGTSYPSYGEYSYSDGDYTYYHDGNGGTYSTYTGGGTSYPSYGEYSNSGTYDNQIEVNGSYYNNGSYSYMEYHDGMGGTYSEYSYSYQPYGYEFTSSSWYDDTSMMTYYTAYLSDGDGGYYTSST